MSGGFCISDYVESMANDVFINNEIVFAKTPEEFKTLVDFYVKNPDQHYHIPLLISPFAYSTYRGT